MSWHGSPRFQFLWGPVVIAENPAKFDRWEPGIRVPPEKVPDLGVVRGLPLCTPHTRQVTRLKGLCAHVGARGFEDTPGRRTPRLRQHTLEPEIQDFDSDARKRIWLVLFDADLSEDQLRERVASELLCRGVPTPPGLAAGQRTHRAERPRGTTSCSTRNAPFSSIVPTPGPARDPTTRPDVPAAYKPRASPNSSPGRWGGRLGCARVRRRRC
ncbi:hypothetical protein ABIA39_008316 [Nocardia sp. GAS34]